MSYTNFTINALVNNSNNSQKSTDNNQSLAFNFNANQSSATMNLFANNNNNTNQRFQTAPMVDLTSRNQHQLSGTLADASLNEQAKQRLLNPSQAIVSLQTTKPIQAQLVDGMPLVQMTNHHMDQLLNRANWAAAAAAAAQSIMSQNQQLIQNQLNIDSTYQPICSAAQPIVAVSNSLISNNNNIDSQHHHRSMAHDTRPMIGLDSYQQRFKQYNSMSPNVSTKNDNHANKSKSNTISPSSQSAICNEQEIDLSITSDTSQPASPNNQNQQQQYSNRTSELKDGPNIDENFALRANSNIQQQTGQFSCLHNSNNNNSSSNLISINTNSNNAHDGDNSDKMIGINVDDNDDDDDDEDDDRTQSANGLSQDADLDDDERRRRARKTKIPRAVSRKKIIIIVI